jgi:hypothetical protein
MAGALANVRVNRAKSHDMNGRFSRLQMFLAHFERLKAATGNNPEMLRTFDQTTVEIRAAAVPVPSRQHQSSYFRGSVTEEISRQGNQSVRTTFVGRGQRA